MKRIVNQKAEAAAAIAPSLSLGEYAYQVINEHYRGLVKCKKKVLADVDPEDLHKMRVASRRLRTALQVFGRAVELPKPATVHRLSALAKILGQLRDLDVQLADLTTTYRPQLEPSEQKLLDPVIKTLHKRRTRAYAVVKDALNRPRYDRLKMAYADWLEQPHYRAIAQLPLRPLLPDLLNPLLSNLLLHPGWLIPANHTSLGESHTLHDLRKVCKQVRYQAEFFLPCYGEAFANWMQETKTLQDKLGLFQDSQVLIALLEKHLSHPKSMPGLQAIIQRTQTEALSDWDSIRQHYLDPAFRAQLHHLLLDPLFPTPNTQPKKRTTQDPSTNAPSKKTAAKQKTTPKTTTPLPGSVDRF